MFIPTIPPRFMFKAFAIPKNKNIYCVPLTNALLSSFNPAFSSLLMFNYQNTIIVQMCL